MNLISAYKSLFPEAFRNRVASVPFVQSWRNGVLVAEGKRLSSEIRASRQKNDYKIRVTLMEARRGFWLNHASIYEAMEKDPDFEVHVLAVPKRMPAGEMDWDEYVRLLEFFDGEGIPCQRAYEMKTQRWMNPLSFGLPDVVFLPHPYDFQQNYMYGSGYWKRFCKVAFLSYGLTINSFPFIFHAPCYDNCSFLFMDSEAHRNLFAELSPEHTEKLIVTGHPSLDAYLRPFQSLRHWPFKSPQSTRRIIWAPHFTIAANKTEHHFSNFFTYFETFIRLAKAHPELEIVLRPHPELFNLMVSSGLKSRKAAMDYRTRFGALPNAWICEDADYISLFRQSDALILDSISFIGAYAPTGKPLCFLESAKRERLNSMGERLLHANYAAWDDRELLDFVESVVLGGDDYLKNERAAVVKKVLYMPQEGAGLRIACELKNRLKPECFDGSGKSKCGHALPLCRQTTGKGREPCEAFSM